MRFLFGMIALIISLGAYSDVDGSMSIIQNSEIKASDINLKFNELRTSIENRGVFSGDATVQPFNIFVAGQLISKSEILSEFYKISSLYGIGELSLSDDIVSAELNSMFSNAKLSINSISETFQGTYPPFWANSPCSPCDVTCTRFKQAQSCSIYLGNVNKGSSALANCADLTEPFNSPAGNIDVTIANGYSTFSCLEGDDAQTLVSTSCNSGYILSGEVCEQQELLSFFDNQCSLDYYQNNANSFTELFPNLLMDEVLELEVKGKKGIYSTTYAFSALLDDGTVKVWGDDLDGGNPLDVVGITNVKEISSNADAFAALLNDGTVRVWGRPTSGGNPLDVVGITNVKKIYSNNTSFAALLNDGTVRVWGDVLRGGDSLAVANLTNVKEIYPSKSDSYTALLDDGTIWAWGGNHFTPAGVPYQMAGVSNINIIDITSNAGSYAALLDDGTIRVWGSGSFGGLTSSVSGIANVKKIYSTNTAFAALLNDGTIRAWGSLNTGGNPAEVLGITNVKEIYSNTQGFTALLDDGAIRVWGDYSNGVTPAHMIGVTGIKEVYSTGLSFAGLLNDGTIRVWGRTNSGGYPASVVGIVNAKKIYSTNSAFAALKEDGTVQVWGDYSRGGNPSEVIGITNVKEIYSNEIAFAALKEDGTVQVWGNGVNSFGMGTFIDVSINNFGTTSIINYEKRGCFISSCENGFFPDGGKTFCE
jgi:hypothetical protein